MPNRAMKLHEAARDGLIDEVTSLLDAGASADDADATGAAALHHAASNGHLAVAALLLDRGAPVNRRDSARQSALDWAIFDGRDNVALLLMERGADFGADRNGSTAVHWAAEGHAALLAALADRGAELNARETDGGTALHIAAEYGHAECVTLLLDRGARADARNNNDATALHLAAEYSHLEIVRALVERGASKDTRTRNAGLTPAAMARRLGPRRDRRAAVVLAPGLVEAAHALQQQRLDGRRDHPRGGLEGRVEGELAVVQRESRRRRLRRAARSTGRSPPPPRGSAPRPTRTRGGGRAARFAPLAEHLDHVREPHLRERPRHPAGRPRGLLREQLPHLGHEHLGRRGLDHVVAGASLVAPPTVSRRASRVTKTQAAPTTTDPPRECA